MMMEMMMIGIRQIAARVDDESNKEVPAKCSICSGHLHLSMMRIIVIAMMIMMIIMIDMIIIMIDMIMLVFVITMLIMIMVLHLLWSLPFVNDDDFGYHENHHDYHDDEAFK